MMSDSVILAGIANDKERDATVLALIKSLGHTLGEEEARKFVEWVLNRKLEGDSIVAQVGDRVERGGLQWR